MPEPKSIVGAPCWVDLTSSDPQRVIPFYSGLFGWSADTNEDPQYGGYSIFSKDGKPIAGLGPQQEGNPYGNIWTVYLASEDAAATADKAAAAGGQVMMPAMVVGDQGTMAIIGDPAGAVVGVWQADQHRGFGLVDEAGAPVWFETMSRDYAAALPFYESVFGWRYDAIGDGDEFRYSQAKIGDEMVAGAMDASGFLPEGVPSFWQFYVGVQDTDLALEKVVELGGTVVRPAEDTPFGRLAAVADPLGANFQISSIQQQ
ncbi:glyoxalase/Bleomycin resistance /Dioxygenase superfamily protein [Rhodococcus sp. MTM3W5.2]|uniref:VOC family protein n=1 Tax=Rhodococcus sp. MTM3W5.2 TaxID=1805827 RepID=UPI000979614F|nr:VOC family protein [Rhodococcus sp. MTM3W5.2]AQA25069.1 glyoxalase/Bleomycin resistance /Dioxygenase superfamily protein [Rhodococcus sp. MTM3W5.2]